MTRWDDAAAIAALEKPLLQGDRGARVSRSAAQAARAMSTAATSPAPAPESRRTLGLTWLPMILAICALTVFPVRLDPEPKLITATIAVVLVALCSVPIGWASLRSPSDESHVLQIVTLLCTAAVVVGVLILSRDPGSGEAARTGLPSLVAVVSFLVTATVSIPQILRQRRLRREVDDWITSLGVDEAVAERAERALSAQNVHPLPAPPVDWARRVARLPRKDPLRLLCDRRGPGAATVWIAGHPYGEDGGDESVQE